MPIGNLYVFFWKNVYTDLIGLFAVLMWNCMQFFVCVDINSLSDISFENMFSHSVGGLYDLLIVPFTVQKIFALMYSHVFIFAFISFAQKDISKKVLLNPWSRSYCLCFLL